LAEGVPRLLALALLAAATGGCCHRGSDAAAALAVLRIATLPLEIAQDVHDVRSALDADYIRPTPIVVGRVTAVAAWGGEENVAFQEVLLLADGVPVGRAGTDREGHFEVIADLPDGHYELALASDVFAARAPVQLHGWRPRTVTVLARRLPRP
jgi:hypothetical protein